LIWKTEKKSTHAQGRERERERERERDLLPPKLSLGPRQYGYGMYGTRRAWCGEFDRIEWERASPFQRALKLEVYVMRSSSRNFASELREEDL
jgi:hypothetical protein